MPRILGTFAVVGHASAVASPGGHNSVNLASRSLRGSPLRSYPGLLDEVTVGSHRWLNRSSRSTDRPDRDL